MVDHGLVGERTIGERDCLSKALETDWDNLLDHLLQFPGCLQRSVGPTLVRFTNPAAVASGLELVGNLQPLVLQTTERPIESSTLPLEAVNLVRNRLEFFAHCELAAIVRVTLTYRDLDLIMFGLGAE